MANIKWKERFAQVYEDSGVKDKYNEFKGYMSNVAEKLNMPSFDEVRGKVSTYADSFTDKVKEGYVNAKTGFTNIKGDFADDGKLNYSNMDLESDVVVDSNVTYNVVGAGIVEQQNESSFEQHNQNHITGVDVEININDNEAHTQQRQDNSLSGKWTVWEAGAPIGGILNSKEEAEQWRENHNIGEVKSWNEITAARDINTVEDEIVSEEVVVETGTPQNPLAGKWTVWTAGAPIGGTHDTKESAEQWRKEHGNVGDVRSWDEIQAGPSKQVETPVESKQGDKGEKRSFFDSLRDRMASAGNDFVDKYNYVENGVKKHVKGGLDDAKVMYEESSASWSNGNYLKSMSYGILGSLTAATNIASAGASHKLSEVLPDITSKFTKTHTELQGNKPMSPGPLNKMLKDRVTRGNEAELQEIVNQSKETVALDEFDNM